MYVDASAFMLKGTPQITHIEGTSTMGTEKIMSRCADCGSVVFGGKYGVDDSHTIYVGTLDDDCVDRFEPKIALFVKDRPAWAKLERGLKEFEEMPSN
jgi:hypothetical protein